MRVLLLAIDDDLVATLLATSLGSQWRISPLVRTVQELRLAMERWKPTMLLASLVLGGESAAIVLRQLASRYSACSILVCHPGLDPVIKEWLQLGGVKAVIDYHTSADQLRAGLEALLTTGVYPPPPASNPHGLADGPASRGSPGEPHPAQHYQASIPVEARRRPLVPLVPRERELLTHFQLGHSHEEAAVAMGLSRKTVEHYSHTLRTKFGFPARIRVAWSECMPD